MNSDIVRMWTMVLSMTLETSVAMPYSFLVMEVAAVSSNLRLREMVVAMMVMVVMPMLSVSKSTFRRNQSYACENSEKSCFH